MCIDFENRRRAGWGSVWSCVLSVQEHPGSKRWRAHQCGRRGMEGEATGRPHTSGRFEEGRRRAPSSPPQPPPAPPSSQWDPARPARVTEGATQLGPRGSVAVKDVTFSILCLVLFSLPSHSNHSFSGTLPIAVFACSFPQRANEKNISAYDATRRDGQGTERQPKSKHGQSSAHAAHAAHPTSCESWCCACHRGTVDEVEAGCGAGHGD